MLSRRFAMSVAYSIAGLLSALVLAGCGLVPTSGPVCMDCTPWAMVTRILLPTPVPIATWVAQGIPADTRIYYHWENDFLPSCSETEIQIMADGNATYESCEVRYAGQLSAEALKRVILAFEEYGFFALTVDDKGCVVDITQPPAPSATLVEKTDAGYTSVSITINGTSKSLYYYNGYSYTDYSGARKLGALLGVLEDAVKDLPAATPTPAPGTPEAGEMRTRSEDGKVMAPVAAAEFLREMSASLGSAAQGGT